ncbi:MAG: hypothetical protein HUU55_11920 [Myxococcales bacterium]|nr:hypothetical protein [Myxococcales bacterium]
MNCWVKISRQKTGNQTFFGAWIAAFLLIAVPMVEAAPTALGERGGWSGLYDPSGKALTSFHAALRQAENGTGQARIVIYGASHTASDTYSGTLRRMLQSRFGDAGHGFVLPARPWRSYRHADVNIDSTLTWWGDWIGKSNTRLDGLYGLAGVSVATASKSDYASVFTTEDNVHGQKVSRFELYYLIQPGGGTMDIRVDGRLVKRVETAGLTTKTGYYLHEVPDGKHRLDIYPQGDGEVRIFGVAMDRMVSGVIVDTLGINGARAEAQLKWNEELWADQIQRRDPDLVVLAYGTNECGDDCDSIDVYKENLREVLRRFKRAVPRASCLLIGPSDRPIRDSGLITARPRQAQIVETQKIVSKEFRCGFFDLVAFMGGETSMATWVAEGLASTDHIHLTSEGYDRMAEAVYETLLQGYDGLVRNPSHDAVPTSIAP